jgi:hypothetical protein
MAITLYMQYNQHHYKCKSHAYSKQARSFVRLLKQNIISSKANMKLYVENVESIDWSNNLFNLKVKSLAIETYEEKHL